MIKKLFVLSIFLFVSVSVVAVNAQDTGSACSVTFDELTFVNNGFPNWAISPDTAYQLYLDLKTDEVQDSHRFLENEDEEDTSDVSIDEIVLFFDHNGPMDNPVRVLQYSYNVGSCTFAETDESEKIVVFISIRRNSPAEVTISHLMMGYVYALGGDEADALYYGAQAYTAVIDVNDLDGCPSFVSETESKSACEQFQDTLEEGN